MDVPDRPPEVTLYLGVDASGNLQMSYAGPTRQGEAGSDWPANALVGHLNESGATWSEPERPIGKESGVDYISRGPSGTLAIQVTRVPHDPAHWQNLQRDRYVAGAADIVQSALDLIIAIRRKGRKSRPNGNALVTLVLDGSTSLVYTLTNTLETFVREYHDEANEFGFASIWLLGVTHLVCLSEGERLLRELPNTR